LLAKLRVKDWKAAGPAIAAILILVSCFPSRINLGVRHILAIYPLLSIASGYIAAHSTTRLLSFRSLFVGLCLIWCVVTVPKAHPDYLPYFNEIASSRPEYFRVDSDLDWGQDLWRLSSRLRALGAPSLQMSYFGTADLKLAELPPVTDITCSAPLTGYVAISAT